MKIDRAPGPCDCPCDGLYYMTGDCPEHDQRWGISDGQTELLPDPRTTTEVPF